jgi:bacterioferritin
MRHFDWLSELIVELGGKPSMERSDFTGIVDDIPQNMRFNIQAENMAIEQYRKHWAMIDDPKIRRLLSRILSDEEAHLGDFKHFEEKAEREATESSPSAESSALAESKEKSDGEQKGTDLGEILNVGIRHEYTVILQYLYHEYMMPDCEVGEELDTQAINEMQHLGWLAEELEEANGTPDIEHTELELEGTPEEMLQADIDVERAVTAIYSQQIPKVEDEEIKALLTRIRDHEIYHAEVFADLKKEVAEDKPAKAKEEAPTDSVQESTPTSTIGDLFGKSQE